MEKVAVVVLSCEASVRDWIAGDRGGGGWMDGGRKEEEEKSKKSEEEVEI